MSTRGFVTLVIDGQEKTVFNHWDSYPSALGIDVLTWLRGSMHFAGKAQQQARDLKMIPEGEAADGTLFDVECNVQQLLNAGAAVDSSEFPLDSLFAEYGYVIDFDAQQLEVYEGFQTKPHQKGRFAARRWDAPPHVARRSNTYYPVALRASWPFSCLPTDRQFENALMNDDDEGDEDGT